MIASNKQRQEHNNLGTIWRAKLKGADEALQEPLPCPRTQTQTLTRMDKEVIEDFYHMTTMDECVLGETNTSVVKSFF